MSLILDLIYPKFCAGCNRQGEYLCPKCQAALISKSLKPPSPPLSGTLSVFRYQDPIRALIHDLKFGFVSDLVPLISQIISQSIATQFPHLLQYWQEQQFVITPIPLHALRENYRGFNQAGLIARALADKIKLKYQDQLVIRSRFTSTQSLQGKSGRFANVATAFSLSPGPTPSKLILFDDVCTTAATLKSAASVFPKNTEVFGLTFAG